MYVLQVRLQSYINSACDWVFQAFKIVTWSNGMGFVRVRVSVWIQTLCAEGFWCTDHVFKIYCTHTWLERRSSRVGEIREKIDLTLRALAGIQCMCQHIIIEKFNVDFIVKIDTWSIMYLIRHMFFKKWNSAKHYILSNYISNICLIEIVV